MRRPALAALAAILVVVPVAQAQRGHRAFNGWRTVNVTLTLPNAQTLTNPPGLFTSQTEPPPGAYTFAGTGTVAGPGPFHGRVVYSGVMASSNDQIITPVLQLKGGTISAEGVGTEASNDVEHFSITGGTGRFRGIRGEAINFKETSQDTPTGVSTIHLKLIYKL